ncbi:MAG: hypothetical protein IAX21_08165 [Candidatus Bathyarchaeota archaeon]|nr:MAG: hypothetical protein IAX21_08165 [Candidatus Bathyarchaeota archaeon]
MVSVTIEYVILIPLLFTQVIIFPLVASTMTSNWQETQLSIELQDSADHLVSTIQQLYLSVNSNEILTGTVTHASPVPVTIASYPYTVDGQLSNPLDDSAKVFTVILTLDNDVSTTVTASAVLGTNVQWLESSFRSTSFDASIIVEKFSNGTLSFTFGGS